MSKMDNLTFRISTGLKNIIGRELITNKFIAIFELVKNSYDAGAHKVTITFENINTSNASIMVSDDGCGMDEDDIINKWLFVAYSEKKDKMRSGSYRETYSNRTYAGAKGVGRFSCDSLGTKLELYSKKNGSKNGTNLIKVNWDDFEADSHSEFVNIPVKHEYTDNLPNGNQHGTSILITNLREEWDRESILDLKKSLTKLVSPYESSEKDDTFEIFVVCESEKNADKKESNPKDKVNGKIENYIFETLNIKTTQIFVSVSEDGETITTRMFDRGIYLFELIQKNSYRFLSNVKVQLFFLNRSAKVVFFKIMGISPKAFGTIFVYKNGFRIMPYGESGSDVFNIDSRKQQGFRRFLGTRDLMGRVIILGDNPELNETSSRDGGLIKTNTYEELVDYFKKYALLPLEKYVVGLIKWSEPSVVGANDEVSPETIKKEIIDFITNYQKKGDIVSVDFNPDLFEIVEGRKENKEKTSIDELKKYAEQYEDQKLADLASKVEKQNERLKKERQELQKQADKATEELEKKDEELETTKKQALFLRGLTNPKFENATESLHLMNTYAKSIKLNIDKVIKELSKTYDKELYRKIENNLFEIIKATQKISNTYTIAFSADYDIKYHTIETDIYDFITQYLDDALFSKTGDFIKAKVQSDGKNHKVKINPLEFSIVIENIIYNSFKARAKNIIVNISSENEWTVIKFSDDGVGLSKSISDPQRIFELGFTTTGGSGVGLAHAAKIINDLGGTIEANTQMDKGFEVIVRLKA